MRALVILIFIALALPLTGQTKVDLVKCLNLAFSQDEFQPAFTNHESTKGNLIIVSPASKVSRRSNLTLNDFRAALTDDDFRSSNQYIKILRTDELVHLGIPNTAALEIFASGDESEITLKLESLIWNENQRYSWSYRFNKIADEWEIVGRNLSKQNVNFSTW